MTAHPARAAAAGMVAVLGRRYADYDGIAAFLDLELDQLLANISPPDRLQAVTYAVVTAAEREG
jgi:hypothetical protein